MRTMKKYQVIITVLSILLTVSVALLIVQFVRKNTHVSGAMTVSNSIGSAEQTWTFETSDLKFQKSMFANF